ncbi:MAG TPA: TonB family protein [Saprospiraceae bacterium]|nr:TonB family protein [Saprospiraceae bacterium]HMQ84492.1 TonB family protein [Saprospiraceae bacterium]
MLNYLLEVNAVWLVLWGLYALLLRQSTFFGISRFYLLCSFGVGLLFPLVEWPMGDWKSQYIPIPWEEINWLPLVEIGGTHAIQSDTVANSALGFSVWPIVGGMYVLGILLALSRLVYGLIQLRRLWRSSEKQYFHAYCRVLTDRPHTPFSFFNYLFWSKQIQYSAEETQQIIQHEMQHIQKRHSWDLLFATFVQAFFWFSPFAYLLGRSLRVVHEYQADAAVLKYYKKKQYGQLLLRQSMSGPSIALAHYFFQSQLKQRLIMMTKTKSPGRFLLRYALALPALLGLAILFSSAKIPAVPSLGAFFLEAGTDRPALFAGCENTVDAQEANNCSKQKLMEHIIKYLKYPEAAKKAGIEGKVLVELIISAAGKVTDIKVVQGLGYGCDEAAVAVLEQMPDWIPAQKDGKAVASKMTLPFQFKLTNEGADSDTKAESADDVFKVVDQMPRFPGCEGQNLPEAELLSCSQMQMLQYIYQNIKYPEDARNAGAEGVCVASFVVEKDGSVSDVKIARSVFPSIDEMVLKLVASMNHMEEKWIPGQNGGATVRVQFNLPVKFKLDSGSTEEKQAPKLENTLALKDFSASPNPTSGVLRLRFQAQEGPLSVQILDVAGKMVMDWTSSDFFGYYDEQIDLSGAASGVLIVRISQNGLVFTEKVTLQKGN